MMIHDDESSWCRMMLHRDASWWFRHDASWWFIVMSHDDAPWWIIMMNHDDESSRLIRAIHHDEPSWSIMMKHHDASWWFVKMNRDDSSWFIMMNHDDSSGWIIMIHHDEPWWLVTVHHDELSRFIMIRGDTPPLLQQQEPEWRGCTPSSPTPQQFQGEVPPRRHSHICIYPLTLSSSLHYLDQTERGYVQFPKSDVWKWIPAKRQLPHALRACPPGPKGPYGPHGLEMDPHGSIWAIWLHMDPYGATWSIWPHEPIWVSVGQDAPMWIHTDAYGSAWAPYLKWSEGTIRDCSSPHLLGGGTPEPFYREG